MSGGVAGGKQQRRLRCEWPTLTHGRWATQNHRRLDTAQRPIGLVFIALHQTMNAPQKIVLVINDLKGNGAERVVVTLARAFLQAGHDARIICFNDTMEYDVTGLRIAHFPMKRWRWVPRGVRGKLVGRLLDRFIRRQVGGDPDLVLSNLLPCDRLLSASRLPNVRLIVHSVLSEERGGWQAFKEMKIYGQKPVVCVSEGVRQDYVKLFPHRANQAITIHNPVNVDWIREQAELPSPAFPEPYIVHVGKFKTEKRHDILLKAFAQSSFQGHLVLIGQGALRPKAEQLAHDLGIQHRVVFAGYLINPFPAIKGAQLLVLSSDYEGLGMVLLEAVALGTPTLSTDCPCGPSEIVGAQQLVPVGDVNALAAKLSVGDFSCYRVPWNPQFDLACARDRYLSLIA